CGCLDRVGPQDFTDLIQPVGQPVPTPARGRGHLSRTESFPGSPGKSRTGQDSGRPPTRLFRTNFREPEDAAQLINDHVRAETRGKITDLVRELKPSTQLVLANYIYFKALWEKPFILAQTKPQDFYVDESTVVQVPMMLQHQQHRWYLQDQHLACSVLRMDYKGGASALFVLPDRGKMAQVEEALTPGTLRGWDSLLSRRNFYKPLELHLPKFSISGSYLLNQILPKLGFTELVSPRADFSGISEREKLQVSRVSHLHHQPLETWEGTDFCPQEAAGASRCAPCRHMESPSPRLLGHPPPRAGRGARCPPVPGLRDLSCSTLGDSIRLAGDNAMGGTEEGQTRLAWVQVLSWGKT
ncbi:kallistatin, partial [Oryctolagus cuniculus]|uniref:kallistatin n=1 Tax=Oryctolagus cuniculus TaxID=9986 RepID=UPI0038796A22